MREVKHWCLTNRRGNYTVHQLSDPLRSILRGDTVYHFEALMFRWHSLALYPIIGFQYCPIRKHDTPIAIIRLHIYFVTLAIVLERNLSHCFLPLGRCSADRSHFALFSSSIQLLEGAKEQVPDSIQRTNGSQQRN